MAELMGTIQGKVIMSINSHADILALFREFSHQEVQISYTVGGGGGNPKRELIIRNW